MKNLCFLILLSTTFACILNDDCLNDGKCNRGECSCEEGYMGDDCFYKQKNKLAALGFGADRFYLGYIGIGILKLILTLITIPMCSIWLYLLYLDDKGPVKYDVHICVMMWINVCLAPGTIIWWVMDWGLILKDQLFDFNGYPLLNNM